MPLFALTCLTSAFANPDMRLIRALADLVQGRDMSSDERDDQRLMAAKVRAEIHAMREALLVAEDLGADEVRDQIAIYNGQLGIRPIEMDVDVERCNMWETMQDAVEGQLQANECPRRLQQRALSPVNRVAVTELRAEVHALREALLVTEDFGGLGARVFIDRLNEDFLTGRESWWEDVEIGRCLMWTTMGEAVDGQLSDNGCGSSTTER